MPNLKKDKNVDRIMNLKRASLIFKEEKLNYQIKKGYDEKTIMQTRNEISKLKSEIQSLK